jgi:hypothetical protein
MGWYRCDCCGYEALRERGPYKSETMLDCACGQCAGHGNSHPKLRRPQAGSGLVCFSIKGENK